jgi:hypothetical protein
MTASRIKPEFFSPQFATGTYKWGNDRFRWVKAAFIILTLYLFFSVCVHIQTGTATKFDLIIGAIIGIWAILSIGVDSPEVKAAKQKWKDTSTFADVTIVSRHYRPGGTYYDEYEIPHTARPTCTLDLEMNADQRAVAPNEAFVGVTVYENIFKMLEKRDTVRIYYKLEAPLTFALEEELGRM